MSGTVLWCTLAWIFMLTLGVPHHCMAQPNSTTSTPTTQRTEPYALNRTVDLLQRLADARVFSGTVAVQKGGSIVFSGGYGYAMEELNVPMKADHIFPIGSESKFFTTVAINQLVKHGVLNISDPVAKHLDPADFPALQGRPWCPLVHGTEGQGCQNVTVEHLLTMRSGVLPMDMGGCDDIPGSDEWKPGDWYYPYRVTALNLTYGEAQGVLGQGRFYNGSDMLVDLVNRIKVLEMPLIFAPGDGWCYEDANYNILGYIVEKNSNMSLGEYIHKNVLGPANLTDTFYWNGAPGSQPTGLRHRMLPVPAYITQFTGTAPPYSYIFSRRYFGWTGELAFSVGASGAVFSTVADSLKWYMTFLVRPEVLRLSKADIKSMITPKLEHPLRFANGTVKPSTSDAAVFAQGIGTHGSPNSGHGIEFGGAQWGFNANTRIWTNDRDIAQSDGIAIFVNSTPHIAKGENCSVVSPVDKSTINLSASVCGFIADEGDVLTDYILTELATIWNITGVYLSPGIPTATGAG